jgi:hypothetical protein
LVTPSETVLLRPSDLINGHTSPRIGSSTPLFLGQTGLNPAPAGSRYQIFEDGPELPSYAWALAMLTTAFLALERRGWARLESREMRKWAGLSKRDGLVSIPARQWPDGDRWPEPSLEWELSRVSAEREVRAIVKDWLEYQSKEPGESALARGRGYLVARGLIVEEKVKRLRFFTSSRFVLPAATAESIPAPTEAADLVADCQRDQSDLWQLLNDDTWQGLKSRWHDPDADYDYDFDD